MKTITITSNNRPKYLSGILDCLRQQANLSDWHVVVSVEPGPYEVRQLIKDCGFSVQLIDRVEQLGVLENPYRTLQYVFEQLGSEYNLYLEEDIIISPDVTSMADWYVNQVLDDVLSLNLCCDSIHRGMTNDPNVVWKTPSFFSPLGMVITDEQWYAHFNEQWHRSIKGWDWSIHKYLRAKKNLYTMRPECTRSKHVGKHGGVHTDPEKFESHSKHVAWPVSGTDYQYRLECL